MPPSEEFPRISGKWTSRLSEFSEKPLPRHLLRSRPHYRLSTPLRWDHSGRLRSPNKAHSFGIRYEYLSFSVATEFSARMQKIFSSCIGEESTFFTSVAKSIHHKSKHCFTRIFFMSQQEKTKDHGDFWFFFCTKIIIASRRLDGGKRQRLLIQPTSQKKTSSKRLKKFSKLKN